MKHELIDKSKRRPTNVSLPSELVEKARALGINVSKACETGLAAEVTTQSVQQWREENRDWIEAHRRWVEGNPLPLERFRLF